MKINEDRREDIFDGFVDTMCNLCFVGDDDSNTYAAFSLELAPEARDYIRKTCKAFCDVVELHFHPGLEIPDIATGVRFGTDLYMSMQGYSRAFEESCKYDKFYGDIQNASYLDRLADAFGSIDPEAGDDGLVHIIQEGE